MAKNDEQKQKTSHILLGVGCLFLLLSIICFSAPRTLWALIISGLIILVLDSYLFLTFINAARSRSKFVVPFLIGFPSLVFGVLIFFVILLTLLFSFSTLYINSGGIVRNAPELDHSVNDQTLDTVTKKTINGESVEIMTSRLDAFYFSLVTMTTLGYGDYTPATRKARSYGIFQIFTSLFLLAGGFSLLISRITSYSQTYRKRPPATVKSDIDRYKKRTKKLNEKNIFKDGEKYSYPNKDGTWKDLSADEIDEAKKLKRNEKIKKPMTKDEYILLKNYLDS